jgi:hypothetical protein
MTGESEEVGELLGRALNAPPILSFKSASFTLYRSCASYGEVATSSGLRGANAKMQEEEPGDHVSKGCDSGSHLSGPLPRHSLA